MGRAPKYKTAEAMQEAIDSYFLSCEGQPVTDADGNFVFDKRGKMVYKDAKPPTITGLALALGFNSRQSLINYQGRKQFMDTITRAKARVEEYAEGRLFDRDGGRGAEFTLKCNFKWNSSPAAEQEKDNGQLEKILEAIENAKPDVEQ